ncbi:MAG: 3'-5' exonuclease [Acidobacteriota bacterium]
MTNLLHLAELLHVASIQEHLGVSGLLRWFDRARAGAAVDSEAAQLRLESDERAVKLITIHKSKGLEFNAVYCPFLWENSRADEDLVRCHDPDDGDRLKLDLGSEDLARCKKLAAQEALAESLRLCYVALTRARRLCFVVWGAFKDCEPSPLGYLLHGLAGEAGEQDAAGRPGGASDDELRADLARVAALSKGGLAVSDLAPGAPRGPRPAPREEQRVALDCREPTRRLGRLRRSSSVSDLASHGRSSSPEATEGRDRDEVIIPPAGPEAGPAEPQSERVFLADFPRGPDAGTCLHSLLERLDFTRPGSADLAEQAALALREHGLDERAHHGPLCRAVREILKARLDPAEPDLRLGAIAKEKSLRELGFVFPAATARTDSEFTAKRLAAALARRESPPWPDGYPEQLARLGFEPLRGFLRGFIDLAFEYQGRWRIADYKSNFLGPRAGDDGPEALRREMAAHHYFLQYHIYLVALHRWLGLRLPGYDYDEHFGGVYYLFLRGLSAGGPAGRGVFFDRPPKAEVEALSRLFGGVKESGGGR